MKGIAVMPVIAFIIQSINKRGFWHLLTILGFGLLIALSFSANGSSHAPNVIAAFALGFLTLLPQFYAIENELRWPSLRLFFYGFYPCHLILLALIVRWLHLPPLWKRSLLFQGGQYKCRLLRIMDSVGLDIGIQPQRS